MRRQGRRRLAERALAERLQFAGAANATSLLVITWDEDAHDEGNRIPTILIASQGVKRGGFQSSTRYTLYSVLRTMEDALGVGPLTNNDRFAAPMNDFFAP